jgi:hypothetical protein
MAYNVLDLQTALQDDLKDPSFSATRLLRYLNAGQLAIFNSRLFKFTEKAVTGSLTIGKYIYDQQPDHQSTIGGVLIDPSNTTFRIIIDKDNYLPHREFFEQYPDPTIYPNAQPTTWTEYSGQIYFDRTVDKAYSFTQRYYKIPASLTTGTDVPSVPESFRELLEYYARSRSEEYRGNHDIAAVYMQKFEDGLETMTRRYSPAPQAGAFTMGSARTRRG